MANEQTVLITGATGKQGGATARALAGKGFKIRAMTRKPESDAAKAVARETGADLIQGDLNDPASLKSALEGAWGVFAVQNTWEAGVAGEEEQGKRIATLARETGIQHYVYTSVGSAHRKTGIPHFDNKYRIEDTVRSLAFPSHVILRPVFFMENLTSPWFLNGDNLYAALAPGTRLQMVAVSDVGEYGARALHRTSVIETFTSPLAGDSVWSLMNPVPLAGLPFTCGSPSVRSGELACAGPHVDELIGGSCVGPAPQSSKATVNGRYIGVAPCGRTCAVVTGCQSGLRSWPGSVIQLPTEPSKRCDRISVSVPRRPSPRRSVGLRATTRDCGRCRQSAPPPVADCRGSRFRRHLPSRCCR